MSTAQKQDSSGQKSELSTQDEDPFDTITDRIPEKPVTVAEAGSYGILILAALGVAGACAYFAVKELLLEPKEYSAFNKALERVRTDGRVIARLGSPITGYGQESRNRATRQRLSHRIWRDEDGVERIQVVFHIRGPHGAGLVHCEMFKDNQDRGQLKFTALVAEILSPVHTKILIESYLPQAAMG